ncbi:MAG: YifB family Mg chelatase-like AAA ATPase [Coriobacteriales bacterium]|nr:YifB family Mg chelatase-like AAA ATPase [Coriobacteriales bacterium]
MSGIAVVQTAMVRGMEALPIRVEVSMSAGLPGIVIVGRPDPAIAESRSRVRCALKSAGFKMPRESVTVNLSPAEIPKMGTSFDLPIALAILAASGQIPTDGFENALIVGELSLDGRLRTPRGLVACAALAVQTNKTLICPKSTLFDAIGNIHGRFVSSLDEFRNPLSFVGEDIECVCIDNSLPPSVHGFSDVAGQSLAKRALAIGASARLGVLMIGPPGIGKTLLASCIPSLLPPLNDKELYETALLHSLVGDDVDSIVSRIRPFRAPHHSTSMAGLIGGGKPVRPGEISLAHNGVLFLDEMGEFASKTLQALRQPLEEKAVRITRIEGTYEFPCNFELVAASNPCPCGKLGDPNGTCTCTEAAIASYRTRLVGPLIDRVHMVIRLERPSVAEIMAGAKPNETFEWRQKVCDAVAFMKEREDLQKRNEVSEGAMRSSMVYILQKLAFYPKAMNLIEKMIENGNVSVRGAYALVKVARAVADFEQSAEVSEDHVLEAVNYRDAQVIS